MFKHDTEQVNTKPPFNMSPETIIGKSVVVTGDMSAEGDVIIDGSFRGSIITKGSIRVGGDARIEADIEAGSGIIAGSVVGKITIHGYLELNPTASIHGDVTTEQISISQGANINGTVTMTSHVVNKLEDEPAILRKKA